MTSADFGTTREIITRLEELWGVHLVGIRCKIISSDVLRPIFPKMLLAARLKLLLHEYSKHVIFLD